MASGIERSLACLGETNNRAAVDTLIAALDHAPDAIRYGALRCLLQRRDAKVYREIIRRWPEYPAAWHELLEESTARLATELEASVLSADSYLSRAACQAAVSMRDYDVIAPLVAAIEVGEPPHSFLGATLLRLTDSLYEELTGPRDYTRRRDPKLVRRFVLSTLEASVGRFVEHKRLEPVEAFLSLTGRENATLRSALLAGRGELYQTFLESLTHSRRQGVVRLLLSFLDDPHIPRVVLKIIASRADDSFVEALLEKAQHDPPQPFSSNLARVESLAWAEVPELAPLWSHLSEAAQQAAARVIMHSGMQEPRKRAAILSLLQHGHPLARSLATASLAEFAGADLNPLILKLVDDPDPQVQACALVQLRQRNVPGSIALLIKRLESPSAVVRNAARNCLQEFTFARFWAAFEDMKPDVRRSTGALVRKIDAQAIPATVRELRSPARSCRLRALEIASLLGNDKRLQAGILACLQDPDHLVRAEAVRKLVKYPEESTLIALRKMLTDASVAVQDAAQESLERLKGTQVRDEKSTLQWADLLEAGLHSQSSS